MPEAIKSIQESKWMYSIGAFFIGSQISAGLLQTGAFEIYINDELAFSKLETGRQVTEGDIRAIFEPYGIRTPTFR